MDNEVMAAFARFLAELQKTASAPPEVTPSGFQKAVLAERAAGYSFEDIAERHGCSTRTIHRVLQASRDGKAARRVNKRGEVTQGEIAKALGLSANTVWTLVQRGMPTDSIASAIKWNNTRLSRYYGLKAYKFQPTELHAPAWAPMHASDPTYTELAFSS